MSTRKKQIGKVKLYQIADQHKVNVKMICSNCGKKIRTLIFQGTGVCSDDCRKDRDGDHEPAQGIVKAAVKKPKIRPGSSRGR